MSAEEKHTAGPWSFDAFNEVLAGERNYGSMVLGADGETIVAQCIADRDLDIIASAPRLLSGLERACWYLESAMRETSWCDAEYALPALLAIIAQARGGESKAVN